MKRVAVLLFLFAALLGSAHALRAQSAIDVRADSARSDFPKGFAFTLEAASDAGFDEVRLVYQVAPDGVRASAVAGCVGGTVATCNFQLAASPQNVIIPGAEVTYFWRITSGGVTQETEPQLVTYVDSRFQWKTVSDDQITVWYSASEDDARSVLAAARESLDKNSARLQTTVDFPVKVFFYPSAREMQPAILADDAEGVITLGEVVYSDTAMVAADAVPLDIARHEVAHIVIRQAVREPYQVPDWLNEGLAVFSQREPLRGQRDALDSAIERDAVLSVRAISSASAGSQGSTVSLFYGQSWSLVKYLLETYGDQKFADLFRAFNDGATTAEALQQVYGVDQDGLENEWRASVGLPPREIPTQSGDNSLVPTAPRVPTQPASRGDNGASIGLIIAIVALTVVLAGGLGVGGVLIARRYR